MGLVKITFDGSNVSAKQDADINHHITGLVPCGVIKGLGNELAVSVSNNYITFRSGYVQIYGRRIYVEEGSQVYISLDSSKQGYAIIQVDLNSNSATLTKVEGTSIPILTQQNLSASGTMFQMPIAKYSKTTTSVTLDSSFKVNKIVPANEIVRDDMDDLRSEVSNKYGFVYYNKNKMTTSGKYVYCQISKSIATNSIICISLSGTSIFVPGNLITSASSLTQQFIYYGELKSINCEWLSNGQFCLTFEDSAITVKSIVLFNHGGTD